MTKPSHLGAFNYALPAASVPKAANRQVFNSSGTWTKPTGYGSNATVLLEAWGGGGGGYNSCGGGGGGYGFKWYALSSLSDTITVTVGAAGTSAPSSGGNTSIGTYLTAYGGGYGGGSVYGGGGGGATSAAAYPNTPGGPGLVLEFSAGTYQSPEGIGAGANKGAQGGIFKGGGGGNSTFTSGGASAFGGQGAFYAAGAGVNPGDGGGSGSNGAKGRAIITVFDCV